MECFIGLTLVSGKFVRLGLVVLAGAMVGIMSPLVLFFSDMFPNGTPTLEAQYVFKDVVLAAAGLVIAAGALGAKLTKRDTALEGAAPFIGAAPSSVLTAFEPDPAHAAARRLVRVGAVGCGCCRAPVELRSLPTSRRRTRRPEHVVALRSMGFRDLPRTASRETDIGPAHAPLSGLRPRAFGTEHRVARPAASPVPVAPPTAGAELACRDLGGAATGPRSAGSH